MRPLALGKGPAKDQLWVSHVLWRDCKHLTVRVASISVKSCSALAVAPSSSELEGCSESLADSDSDSLLLELLRRLYSGLRRLGSAAKHRPYQLEFTVWLKPAKEVC